MLSVGCFPANQKDLQHKKKLASKPSHHMRLLMGKIQSPANQLIVDLPHKLIIDHC